MKRREQQARDRDARGTLAEEQVTFEPSYRLRYAMALPAGTVTYFLTDIEGSTRLWEQQPDEMRAALAQHDALLKKAIERRGGMVFKTVGDAFYAVFAVASDALSAALSAQQELVARERAGLSIRVRMSLHTGVCEIRDGDYFGPPLNRAARLLSAGHGGQVLLSAATHELTRDQLPEAVTLKELGRHRLRDLDRPEHIFQLSHPDLPADFPPLRTIENLPNNLSCQLTTFIGREREIEQIKRLLSQSSLLTLTGAGGCGKTRLSLQAAANLREEYPDGIFVVELAPIADGALVPQVVAAVLDVREEPGQHLIHALIAHLRGKRLLLLLDNCEHLLKDCAQLVDSLLRACPHLRILTSSREALGISGEQTYPVPTLTVPRGRREASPESLEQYEAARLFIERAAAVLPAFSVTNQNAPALAEICFRLDGIPLAIELAAVRVRSMTVEQIALRLDDRFRLLTGGSRTAPPRQQTLRAALEWSYDLLSDSERRTLNRVSIFSGGWTLDAAEALCAREGIEEWEVLDLLTSLVDKSLVLFDERAEGEGRYRLLETIRHYGRERLDEAGEEDLTQARHLGYYLRLAEEAAPHLTGADQAQWLERLENEHDNLRAALTACQREEFADEGLRLSGALWWFWIVRGHFTEGRNYLDAAHSYAAGARTKAAAGALNGAGALAFAQGDYSSARAKNEESLSIWQEIGDRQGIALSLNNLGNVAWAEGDFESARALYEQSLEINREVEDRRGIATSLDSLGFVAFARGDYPTARALHEESLGIAREIGDEQSIAGSLGNLANVIYALGDDSIARSLYEESLCIQRKIGDRQGMALSLGNLGNVAQRQGDYAAARKLGEESLGYLREIGDTRGVAFSLNNLGNVAYQQGEFATATAFHEQSLNIHRESGNRPGIVMSLNNLGIVAFQQGDYASARMWSEETLSIQRELGEVEDIVMALNQLSAVASRQGDYAAARACLSESIKVAQQQRDHWISSETIGEWAVLAKEERQWKRAARLWGAADRLGGKNDAHVPGNEREEQARDIDAVRDALGDEDFAAAWQQGLAMTIEQAIEYALEDCRDV